MTTKIHAGDTFRTLPEQRIPMRDGVELATDVYLPSDDGLHGQGPYPIVLVRTSYDKSRSATDHLVDVPLFTSRGFGVVLQDVRGRWRSEGVYYHGLAEADDGGDTLDWLASQPWCNGRIGMTGTSYLAAVQTAAALSGSPNLSAIFHVKAPADYYQLGNRHGGNIAMYMVPVTMFFASTSPEAQSDPVIGASLSRALADGRHWLLRQPTRRGLTPLAVAPGLESWLIENQEQELYDDFWKKVRLWQPNEYIEEYADVPSVYLAGWYDMYREPDFVEMLAPVKEGPIRLVMGPWTHFDFERVAGDVDFGEAAAMSQRDYFELQLSWFEETLSGVAKGDVAAVRIFVMGGGDGRKTPDGLMYHGGKWRDESEWPIARAEQVELFLAPGGHLADTAISEHEVPPTTYLHDPANPVPTIGGTKYFLKERRQQPRGFTTIVPYGPQDQREQLDVIGCETNLPLAARADVRIFQTAPLTEDIEVTGSPEIELWFSSSAVDTDFVVKLIDVYPPNEDYPDGYAMNVSEGNIRARFRETHERAELLEPGERYVCRIKLYPTSNLFCAGHRIRLHVASSDFPAFDPNPGTGGSIVTPAGPPVIAHNSLYHDAGHQSRIILPVVR